MFIHLKKQLSVIAATFLLFSGSTSAEPAPFGLEIGKTMVGDLHSQLQYTVSESAHHWIEGQTYKLEELPNVDGLLDVEMIFDQGNLLQGVAADFSARKYHSILELLQSKYRLVDNGIPFHGGRYAVLEDGDTKIFLEAPHMRGGTVSLS